MNKKINNTKFTMNAKVYVVHGNYDEGGQYHEAYYKKFDLKQMPEDIQNNILESMNRGCDFTVLIFPLFKAILAFIPNDRKNKFVWHLGEGVVRELLDSELASSYSKTQLVWGGYNFPDD